MEIKRHKLTPLVSPSTSVLLFVSLLITSAYYFCSHDGRLLRRFATESPFESSSGATVSTPTVFPAVELRQIQSVRSSPGNGSSSSSIARKGANPIISREEELERGLARARGSIRRAAMATDESQKSSMGSIYRNPGAFHRSYQEMEKRFKVYVYKEGDPPIVHDGPCKDIYTVEGRFIHEMEHGISSRRFKTEDPWRAHAFFMPFSVTWMVKYLYIPLSYDLSPLRRFVADYVRVISGKYPFWNRTLGADHFMLSCHDWGPHASRGNKQVHDKSMRVLCNANTSEGFNPRKDVSLPEIHLYGGNIPTALLLSPTSSPNHRPYLGFFAGGLHGPIRPILLNHWLNRNDTELLVFEYLPKNLSYYSFMLKSKFCLCPSGHEVASPRIVEAIYAECVPVILSENYVLPFSDVLRWEGFSVKVDVGEIPNLKEVLSSIPEEEYSRLRDGVRAVRKHFVLNRPAKRFDVFHMILHSVWLRRLDFKLPFDPAVA
ncbi:Probable glycosyltransferase At5g25310 [Linum grandiflorum]